MGVVKSLKELKKNKSATIVDIRAGHPLSERLLEMGLAAGERVEILHEAPLSRDPIVIFCCGTRIALRRSEAELVTVDEGEEK